MSDDPLADPHPPLETSASDAAEARAPAGAEPGVAPRKRLATPAELAAERMSAAERLLAELDEARDERG